MYNAAIADYDVLIGRQPKNAALYIIRGRVFRMLGDLKSAEADFTQASVVDKNAPDAYIELGVLAAAQGNSDLATQNFDKALVRGSNNPRVFAARGRVLAQQGKIADSLPTWIGAVVAAG